MIDKEKQEETYTPNATELLRKFDQKFVYKVASPEDIDNVPKVRELDRRSNWPYKPVPCISEAPQLETNELVECQPTPVTNTHPAIPDLVMQDMRDRDEFGAKKYGSRLQPFNGRDPNIDLYQELLDAVQYTRQSIYERTFELAVINAAIKYVQHQDSNRVSDLFDILQHAVSELADAQKARK